MVRHGKQTKTKKLKMKKKRSNKATTFDRVDRLHVARPNVLHSYLSHREINQYLEYLEYRYNKFIKIHKLGQTYEGRSINAIEINWYFEQNSDAWAERVALINSRRPEGINIQRRNIVFIESGTHGREWMSISVALNCICQLVEKHLRNYELLRKLHFFIVPIVNPDGYEYSRTKKKTWRKNRRPSKTMKFIGTDCNRNYDFHWDDGKLNKSKRNTYKGDKPFSEPETRALNSLLQKHASNILLFLSLHSCSQCLMYPWAYSKEKPKHYDYMQRIAEIGRDSIRAYSGRYYRTGSIANVTRTTMGGTIVDYAHGVLKIPLTLVMELPAVEHGFQPPSETISPIGHESWFGIRAMSLCAFDMSENIRQSELDDNDARKSNNAILTAETIPTTTIAIDYDTQWHVGESR